MLSWLPGSRRRSARSWSTFAATVVSGVALIVLLVIIVSHREAQFPQAKSCPSASVVNGSLGTHVTFPTAASESDLLGCFYQQGSNVQAVSVSFASRASADPCRNRGRIDVSGHEGCEVTGTRATSGAAVSLLVETTNLQDQLSSDLPDIPLTSLERLAAKVLTEAPPRLEASGPSRAPVERSSSG